ncbi:ComEC/Rec2 family competence protein [Sphingobacterium spiritivorum]|uniref:ComEC/Rec2 family competence protein n=1 Tax=Sphingobacterium spiritivorum TaxID=258 RepID=UPI003DA4B9CD
MLKPDPKHIPFVRLLLIFLVGISLGFGLENTVFSVFYLEVILVFFLMITILCFIFRNSYPFRYMYMWGLYILICLFGLWKTVKENPLHKPDHFSAYGDQQLVGIIADEIVVKNQIVRFPVRIIAGVNNSGSEKRSGNLLVTIKREEPAERLQYGDKLILQAAIKDVSPPFNPREFDYQSYLSHQNIWQHTFLNPAQYHVLGHREGNPVLRFALEMRRKIVKRFRQYIGDDIAFQVATAIILGYRSEMDKETITAFSNTGTIHVLSVSGMHVGLVFWILSFLLKGLGRWKAGRSIQHVILLTFIWMYVVLTGLSPSALRAGLMISFFVVSNMLGKDLKSYNTIASSAFFMLLTNTKTLADLGFQLSYLAVLGIVTVLPLLNKLYLPKGKYLKIFIEYMYISIAAQLFTLPLVFYYFGQFPNYFLIANLFIALPSTCMMYVGLVLAFFPLDLLSQFMGNILEWLIQFMWKGLHILDGLPGSLIQGVVFSIDEVILLFLACFFLSIAFHYRIKVAFKIGIICVFVVQGLLFIDHIKMRNYTGIRVYNVKKHLAIAHIRKGKVMLFTNMDSLQHPVIAYSILPDLLRYTHQDEIDFEHVSDDNTRQNLRLSTSDISITVLEKYITADKVLPSKILIMRKNNRSDLKEIIPVMRPSLVIIDGSNTDRKIKDYKVELDILKVPYYCLKDNFAYVWVGD